MRIHFPQFTRYGLATAAIMTPVAPAPPLLPPVPVNNPPALPAPPVQTSETTVTLTDTTLSSIAEVEQKFSQEFSQGLDLKQTETTKTNPIALVQEIEKTTGIKSALIYINFIPVGDRDRAKDLLEVKLVTPLGVKRHRTTIDRQTFTKISTAFRREVTNPLRTHDKSYLPTAQQLYQWILQPIRAQLDREQINNLVFLPEAGARAIPFAALHDGQGFLVEHYSVGLMPSVTLTATDYRDLRNLSVLAIGLSEATQGQSPLPTVPTEIDQVLQHWPKGDRLLNQQATVSNLKERRDRRPHGIVHLASHANFTGTQSYIQLWNERLSLAQLPQLGWNDPPLDLLVLSACRTALGDRQSELGFAGLALQMGVKTAVASLWYVDDAATTALMSDFYGHLRRSPIKAEALRRSQLSLIHRRVRLSERGIEGLDGGAIALPEGTGISNYNLDHPYYWATFSMVGNPW